MLVSLLAPVLLLLLLVWLARRFLLPPLPALDPQAERAFLAGKTVWITGASSGIGKALAEHLRAHPSTRVVLSARHESSLSAVKSSLTAAGVRDVLVLPLDLEALASVADGRGAQLAAAAVEAVESRFGRVDILIHNGGMSMRGEVADTSLEVDARLMAVNYLGAVALTKAVLPQMLQRRSGSILAMSSVQGKLPIAFRSSYAASKHAMHAFFHSLRYEVADAGVRVSVVSPGYVRTRLSLNALTGDGSAYGKMWLSLLPLRAVLQDDTTAKGYAPEYVAALTYATLRENRADVVLADGTARAALLLQALAPELLTRILIKRARKERSKQQQDK